MDHHLKYAYPWTAELAAGLSFLRVTERRDNNRQCAPCPPPGAHLIWHTPDNFAYIYLDRRDGILLPPVDRPGYPCTYSVQRPYATGDARRMLWRRAEIREAGRTDLDNTLKRLWRWIRA